MTDYSCIQCGKRVRMSIMSKYPRCNSCGEAALSLVRAGEELSAARHGGERDCADCHAEIAAASKAP